MSHNHIHMEVSFLKGTSALDFQGGYRRDSAILGDIKPDGGATSQ